ncbi:NAD(P)/FAD-dependent oxidoreductase [Chloroflexota bacterium]
MYDVIVVGGGPIGSRVAYMLAGEGHQVLVLERRPGIGEKVCCTGIIGLECVSSFAIGDDVILRYVNSAGLFSPSGSMLRLWRDKPQACILNRAAFDIMMAKRAEDKGAEYSLNSLVRNIFIDKDRVRVEASCQGERKNLEARAVIIASGFGSELGEKLGLGSVGDFIIGGQAEVEASGVDEVEVYFGRDVAPGSFAWLVPTSQGRALAGLISRQDTRLHLSKLLSSLQADGKITSSEAKLGYGGIPLRTPARTYGERVLVIGDAAGQVKPTSGGGIYYGLLCADIAADTLYQALAEDDLSAKRLARYERNWERRLGWELRVGHWARKLFERLSDKQLDRIFNVIKTNGIDEALLEAEDLSFDWHGKAILRLLGHAMVAKVAGAMRVPFRSGKD